MSRLFREILVQRTYQHPQLQENTGMSYRSTSKQKEIQSAYRSSSSLLRSNHRKEILKCIRSINTISGVTKINKTINSESAKRTHSASFRNHRRTQSMNQEFQLNNFKHIPEVNLYIKGFRNKTSANINNKKRGGKYKTDLRN